jgi:hypothetical protein
VLSYLSGTAGGLAFLATKSENYKSSVFTTTFERNSRNFSHFLHRSNLENTSTTIANSTSASVCDTLMIER